MAYRSLSWFAQCFRWVSFAGATWVAASCAGTSEEGEPARRAVDEAVDAAPSKPSKPDKPGRGGSGGSDGAGRDAGPHVDSGGPQGGTGSEPNPEPSPVPTFPSGVGGSPAEPNPNIIPGAWRCTVFAYRDGHCDCGCGTVDPDCPSDAIEDCERCDATESCAVGTCPASIDPDDTTTCLEIPEDWACSETDYFDADCDCGCGIADPNCDDAELASCDTCNPSGGCSFGNCPGAIDPDDTTSCFVPEGWTCAAFDYGDDYCHCGCGVLDVDCASPSAEACDICWTGCSEDPCPGPIDEEDNTLCTGAPSAWQCEERFYGDGSLCNCGCGALDPDCETDTIDACDRCDFEGSCSALACPGSINPNSIGHCVQLQPPPDWRCPSYHYADGYCDCGCGAEDLDCDDTAIESCESCWCGGACPGRVDPANTMECLPVPEQWRCDPYLYGDGYTCDCGCGVIDPDCPAATADSCQYCPAYSGSCSSDYCEDIRPDDNAHCVDEVPTDWTCDADTFGDDACDCGCGAVDFDCASADSECDLCNAPGSCAEGDCGQVDPTNNAVCVP